jgi:hypothetical protein
VQGAPFKPSCGLVAGYVVIAGIFHVLTGEPAQGTASMVMQVLTRSAQTGSINPAFH